MKAKANGIELKTIDETLRINFGEEFHKLGLIYISHIFKLKSVAISFNPPSKRKPTPTTLVYNDGSTVGNLEELTKFCYEEGTKKKLIPYHKQNFLKIFKTRADVEKQMLIEHSVPINELYIESDGEKFYITSITFTLIGVPSAEEIDVKHRTCEGSLISEGIFDMKEMDKIHTTWIAQFPRNMDAKVFVTSKLRETKK